MHGWCMHVLTAVLHWLPVHFSDKDNDYDDDSDEDDDVSQLSAHF